MNEEHYNKVLKVMALTAAAHRELMKKMNAKDSLVALARVSNAFWEQEFPTAQGYGTMTRIDLRGADLRGRVFASLCGTGCLDGADFAGANLEGSLWLLIHAKHADFTNANMRNSVMMGLGCQGARFAGADLSGADLGWLLAGGDDQKEPLDFSGANLTGARIELRCPIGLDFAGANLQGFRVPLLGASNASDIESLRKAREMFLASLTPEQRAQIVTGAGCFIATACYESGDSPEVRDLRRYRDDVLLATWTGRLLVRLYYHLSPSIARLLRSSPFLKTVVRAEIVDPVVHMVRKGQKNATPR